MDSSEERVTSGGREAAPPSSLNTPTPDDHRTPRLTRPVYFSDRPRSRMRRREDMVDLVLALLGIVAVWAFGVYANSTTRGVTQDVLQFDLIRNIILLPVNFVEGMVILVAPVSIIIALALSRQIRRIIEAVSTALAAAAVGWGILALLSLAPPALTAPLRVSTGVVTDEGVTSTAIAINLVVVTLSALFTAAGETTAMRTVKWSWTGLWIISFLWVVRLSMTLPSALISILLGRAIGSGARWLVGFEDRRASGPLIIGGLLSLGITPSRVVRSDVDTAAEPLSTWAIVEGRSGAVRQRVMDVPDAEYAFARRWDTNGHRHYRLWDDLGCAYDVTAVDPGREFTGTLVQVWENLRLRGISRWISPSLKASAERSTLTAVQAFRAGARVPEPVGVAAAGESILMVNRALPATLPLRELLAAREDGNTTVQEAAVDTLLDDAWRQLATAHSRSIAHRNLDFTSVVVDEESHVWLIDWEEGEVATTEINKRIDLAQMLVHLSILVGTEKALASGRRVLGARELRSCAALLQGAVLPSALNAALRRTEILQDLRTALVRDEGTLGASSEAGVTSEVRLADIQRFSPRTVAMVLVLFLAVLGVAGSLNLADIRDALAQAEPWWILLAFAFATLTWVGGAIPLLALSAERLRLRDAILAQIAASLVTLVAPAGIGPAAINLRYLTKQKVSAAAAVTTVTLQQIAQLLVTIGLLIVLLLFTGQRLSITVPYGAILAVVAILAIALVTILVVPTWRRWVWARLSPTWVQVYPRLLWVMGQPRRLLAVLAGNVLTSVGFIGCFWASVTAMGASLDLTTLSITYLASNSLGSVIPSPGGIGPVEAALTGGLQVAGISLTTALSIALIYRLVTFYGRAPFGWLAMKYMERKDLI